MAAKDQGPPTWSDALGQAASILAQGMQAPDADVKFGVALIGAMSSHQQRKSGGAGAGASGAGAPAGGDAGSPPGGAPPAQAAGGLPGGPAGGGAPNPAQSAGAAPGGPVPGGMSPGLSPNPDEMRRVLADVAGK